MDKFLIVIKELRLFIALLLTTGVISVSNQDTTLQYIYAYNIHLALLTIIGIYINHFLSSKRHRLSEIKQDSMQMQLNETIRANSIGNLKAEVSQAFREFKDFEVIDFTTSIKYLRGLDERRIELGVNSYTEDMMTILLNKIQLGVE